MKPATGIKEKPLATNGKAVFTEGSTMRHVLVMTSTGAVGLIAIFFVDVLNLFYISLLGQQELAAAIGYASTIMFFTISYSIGLAIAATAITARAIGSGDENLAKARASASLILMTTISVLISAILYPFLGPCLRLLGATGETYEIALHFMRIVVPSIPFMSMGMCLAALLRARGDAKRAMYVTLTSGISAAFIDPILIFGLDLGITGAAISVIIVRFLFVVVGWYGAWVVHRMFAVPTRAQITSTLRPFFVIGFPAVLTQIATPVGNAYVTSTISEFGDDAVAGWAIIGRLIPLAFAAVFSLSGAIGPILSQNLGAMQFDRVVQTMRDALIFAGIYCMSMWALLAILSGFIVDAFSASGDAADLIYFFCFFVAGSFIFNGALFTANAAFNNLGNPVYSTVFNWGRATLGVVPFVYVGQAYGPEGVLAGWGIGGIIFGVLSVIVCFAKLRDLPERTARELESERQTVVPAGNSPFTTGKGSTFGQ